jgi:phosphoribosylamine--glycine ligase
MEKGQVKVLLVGGGGREHALGWKIAQSPALSKLYLAPGNPGLKPLGEVLAISPHDVAEIAAAARSRKIDLVVVGPEAPLAEGLADRLAEAGVPCFGPTRAAAQLETSKGFMKDVAAKVGAPTAAYRRFRDAGAAKAFLRDLVPPYVVKADGLAAGKGVVIAETIAEGERTIDDFLGGALGAAGRELVIEEFMRGEEASFFLLCDGEHVAPLAAARDHKRAFDGDMGPNTGGMGAYSPAPIVTPAVEQAVLARIVRPVLGEMAARGCPFRGVLYAGLMIGADGPKLIEFNVRFGDPECQILMRRMSSDLLPALTAAATGALDRATILWSAEAAVCVVLASKGYPGPYQSGGRIAGIEAAESAPGVVIFHAGTDDSSGMLRARGGRVLNVTATGATIAEARVRAYAGVDRIDWQGGFCRRDIALGADA